MSVAEAMALFRRRGELERVRLMAHREKETVVLHTLRGRQEYFQGYMVPSTGCLKHFGLHAFPPGFLLQFPHQSRPTEIAPVVPYPKLFSVFEEAGHLLDRLGVRSAGALNDAIASGRLAEVSLVGEAIHESRIAQHRVGHRGPGRPGQAGADRRAVLVREDDVLEAAGGAAAGERPPPVPDRARRLLRRPGEDAEGRVGQYDYECLEAVDVALFNEHLLSLMAGRTTELSRYVFKTGRREPGRDGDAEPRPHHDRRGDPRAEPGAGAERARRVASTASTSRR